jgi:hypothetical protein
VFSKKDAAPAASQSSPAAASWFQQLPLPVGEGWGEGLGDFSWLFPTQTYLRTIT